MLSGMTRFRAEAGFLAGAKDITLLSFNPFLFPNTRAFGVLLLACGFALSLINTRAMLPFALLALLFMRQRKAEGWLAFVQFLGFLLMMGIQMVYLTAGFFIPNGIS